MMMFFLYKSVTTMIYVRDMPEYVITRDERNALFYIGQIIEESLSLRSVDLNKTNTFEGYVINEEENCVLDPKFFASEKWKSLANKMSKFWFLEGRVETNMDVFIERERYDHLSIFKKFRLLYKTKQSDQIVEPTEIELEENPPFQHLEDEENEFDKNPPVQHLEDEQEE